MKQLPPPRKKYSPSISRILKIKGEKILVQVIPTLSLIFIIVLLSNCSKNVPNQRAFPNKNTELLTSRISSVQVPKTQLNDLRGTAMKAILSMAKDKNFRQFILEESLEQKRGEYDVLLKEVVEHYSTTSRFKEEIATLKNLIPKIKELSNGAEPLIFYPRAETIEDLINETTSKKIEAESLYSIEEPVAVYQNVYDTTDFSSPGYRLLSNGELELTMNVSEDYAWQHDIWVIGEEELVRMSALDNEINLPPLMSGRYEGRSEYGGIFQAIRLNKIEHWTAGKLELHFFVFTTIGKIKDYYLGKVKRKHFKNKKWYDANVFIANWYTSNIGNWMYETWIEEDGGPNTTVSQSINIGGTTTTISYDMGMDDDDLGGSLVQFQDDINQIYPITWSNFKHK